MEKETVAKVSSDKFPNKRCQFNLSLHFVIMLVVLFAIFGGVVGYLLGANAVSNHLTNSNQSLNSVLTTDLKDCIEEGTYNLKNNKYLQANELSVTFYATPSASIIKRLTQQYDLEVIQIYKQPNVVFKVSEEQAPTIKCELKNEPEIEKVVFIENRPVP